LDDSLDEDGEEGVLRTSPHTTASAM
jgi:hypothetical protein